MENQNSSRGLILLILVIGILGIAGWAAFNLVNNVNDAIPGPVEGFQTQAAQILDPTPTILPGPATIIRDVQSLARLETIQYTLEKVITAETNQDSPFAFLIGDRLLFVAHGVVLAGVDMEQMEEDDIFVDGITLYVRLPEAEIFVATLDNDKSYVYDRDTGILNQGEINLETAARQAAEDEILTAALEDGILEQAQVNAENYLFRFFQAFGYDEVIFVDPSE